MENGIIGIERAILIYDDSKESDSARSLIRQVIKGSGLKEIHVRDMSDYGINHKIPWLMVRGRGDYEGFDQIKYCISHNKYF